MRKMDYLCQHKIIYSYKNPKINPKITTSMKKFFISAVALLAGFVVSAQLVEVNSVTKVALPEGMAVNIPTISPDGSFVVVTDLASDGIMKIDVADGTSTRLSKANGAFDIRISPDGRNIVYRHSVFKNKLRYTGLRSLDLATGKTGDIVKPSRRLNAGAAISENSTVNAIENGKMMRRNLAGAKAQGAIVASINYGHLDITTPDGRTKTIDPQGRGSYLWPSVSPDGSKVVYYLAGRGCFVAGIDGSNPVALGELRAARWIDNNTIVGMNDRDNGEVVTESKLVASNLSGIRQVLTESAVKAMYPSVSADGRHIAFSTPEGELFILNLK